MNLSIFRAAGFLFVLPACAFAASNVLDFEKNGHYPGGTMRADQAVAFVERIRERTGKYPGLYSGEYHLRQVLNSPKVSPAYKRVLSNCWLWIANYHYEPRATAPWSF